MERRRRSLLPASLVFAISMWPALASAQCELQKLIGNATGDERFFGGAVHLAGNRCIVGAGAGTFSAYEGEAHIFERGEDGVWARTAVLRADDGERDNGFGAAVALQGSQAFVGAPSTRDNGSRGAVYVFQFDGLQWRQIQRLAGEGAQTSARMGASVAVDGEYLAAGAWRDGSTGAAYVFRKQPSGEWLQVARLAPRVGNQMGDSIDIEGTTLVAGDPGYPNGFGPGAAMVFQLGADGTWREVQLVVSNYRADERDDFGEDISLEGNVLYVGAPRWPNPEARGAVFTFERASEQDPFVEGQPIVAPDATQGDLFGRGVAAVGNRVVVGAPGRSGGRGVAYVFERQDVLGWRQIRRLIASDGASGDLFGRTIAFWNGDSILAGAPYQTNENGRRAGATYLYDIACNVELTELALLNGQHRSGGIDELLNSDDNYLITRAEVTGRVSEPQLLRMLLGARSLATDRPEIVLTIEGRITDIVAQTTVYLRDWHTGAFVAVGQFSMSRNERVVTFTVQNAPRFIRQSDGRIEIELKQVVFFPFAVGGFETFWDQIQIRVVQR